MSRLTKLNLQLTRVLAEAFQNYPERDPKLLVTVVAVEVSADISSALVWLSMLGDQSKVDGYLKSLDSNKRYFAEFLHDRFEAKRQPKLIFRQSQSLEKLQDIAGS